MKESLVNFEEADKSLINLNQPCPKNAQSGLCHCGDQKTGEQEDLMTQSCQDSSKFAQLTTISNWQAQPESLQENVYGNS